MRWTVKSENSRNGPTYYVARNKEKKPVSFDCERSAQIFADFLNRKEEEGENGAQDKWK